MAQVTLQGHPVQTNGDMPAIGSQAVGFSLVKTDLSLASLADFSGKKVILNIFPSVDTGTCATSVRKFNAHAGSMDNTVVLCISQDLPFAHARFCGAEGIENVVSLSAFRSDDFAKNYGVEMIDGPLQGLTARSVVIINEQGEVVYTELVPEIVDEPNYDAALAAL